MHLTPGTMRLTYVAEQSIRNEERKPGFALLLLQLTASESYPYNTRLASALFFKNFISRNWTDEDGNYKLSSEDILAIKTEIIGLMVVVPAKIQAQLGQAISVIADSDFWERWPSLVDDLVSKLTADNIVVNTGILLVAHTIFRRWRPLFRSDALYTEINHVLGKFSQPYLALWQNLDLYIETNKTNKTALVQALGELDVVVQLLYDLSCQDLPPVFEDHLASIASLLHKYLMYDNELLRTDSDDEAGPLENVKANIFEVLGLYVQKYYDAFQTQVKNFVGSSWNLLTTTSLDTKNDILVSKALGFLTSVARINEEAKAFEDEATLNQVVEKVILPNISLRDSDVELFEDEPIEYIRRDLEGFDSETRRRAATDFLRQLMTQFEELVTRIVTIYIEKYLQNYNANQSENWRSKDVSVYLFCSIAAKGVPTANHGVRQTNSSTDIGEFFQNNLAGDLVNDKVHPLLKVDAIKYLYLFRSLITKEQWQQVMPLLVNHLGDSNYVVYTYAAIAVERTLYLTSEDGKPIIDPGAVTPLSKELLLHLFSLVEKDPSPTKVQENEFLMRCLMRVLIVIKDAVSPHSEVVLGHLVNILNIIHSNPSNPRFYYYFFEALSALIRYTESALSSRLQEQLFGPFILILQTNVEGKSFRVSMNWNLLTTAAEFMPYVFQLFAALLEADQSPAMPEQFQALINPVLSSTLWEQRGNIPALVRLLQAMLPRAASSIVQNRQLESVLGLFQKLASSKLHESYAFDLLEVIITVFPKDSLEPYWISIMQIMLMRLQNSETQTFKNRFVRFFHVASARDHQGYGTDFYIAVTDKVQQDVFRALYLNVILPTTASFVRPADRKIAVISLTKLCADSEAFVTRYPKGWPHSCNALLKQLEEPPVPLNNDDAIMDHDVEDAAFGVGFTMLQTIKKPDSDPFSDIQDLRKWVGQYLKQADARHGGRIGRSVNETLGSDAKKVLNAYMQL